MTRSASKRTGFTLIELLTVLTLFAMVTGIGVKMLYEISDLWRVTALRTEMGHRAQNALDMIANDVAQTLSAERSGVAMETHSGEYEYAEGSPYWRMHVENDTFTLPTAYANYLSKQHERRRVRYAVERGGVSHRLMRILLPMQGEPTGAAPSVFVADGIVGFRVEFFDGAKWLREWPTADAPGAMPKLVRISLTVQDLNRPYEQVSRQGVYPVRVE